MTIKKKNEQIKQKTTGVDHVRATSVRWAWEGGGKGRGEAIVVSNASDGGRVPWLVKNNRKKKKKEGYVCFRRACMCVSLYQPRDYKKKKKTPLANPWEAYFFFWISVVIREREYEFCTPKRAWWKKRMNWFPFFFSLFFFFFNTVQTGHYPPSPHLELHPGDPLSFSQPFFFLCIKATFLF